MTRTILLADDSVTIQKVVELTFLDEDFQVVTVGNGTEAIERLGEVRPSLVIADVHMPGADGYEVAEAVRTAQPGTPVILLVGTFESFDSARATQAGAADHLKKPFDSQELLRRVQTLLAGAPAVPQAAAPVEPAWGFEPSPSAGGGGEFAFEAEEPIAPLEPPAFDPTPAREEPVFAAPPAAAPAAPLAQPAGGPAGLSDQDVDRIARRVVELIGSDTVRDVAWEVVPDLAEVLLQARIRELEASVE